MRNSLVCFLLTSAAWAAGVPYMTEPALCPTRPEIAFVSGGGIWVTPSKGGAAHLLVSNPADESRPLYSPDGAKLAFISTRTGNGDIYILTIASGDLKRLTFDDGLDQLDAWSRDGKWIYFSNSTNDVGHKNDIYRVSVEGGTPLPVSADRFTNEFQAASSPDGQSVAFAARGVSDQQWWRLGHSHLDESEIWLRREGPPASYQKIVEMKGRNIWPMWMPNGRELYFMSDRDGPQNIWSQAIGGAPRKVTRFKDGRVLWPSISYDGKTIVFERDFKIWQLDTRSAEAYPVPITLVGAGANVGVTHLTLTQFNDLALSPDGRKIALVGHGEIFAASARTGGEAVRVTNTPGPETQITWAPDSTRLAYLSERDAVSHIFIYDFLKHAETPLTMGTAPDQGPRFAPDGKSLAYIRDHKELRVIDLGNKQDRLLISGFFGGGGGPSGPGFGWSPDSKWIAYVASSNGPLRNVSVVPAAGGKERPISFLANSRTASPQWSRDGAALFFLTGQRTENAQVARIDLVPRPPVFAEERFEELFKADAPRTGRATTNAPPVKPVEIQFDDIRERISMLPIGLDVSEPQVSPDGKWLLLSAAVGGQNSLYLFSLEETPAGRRPRGPRQLTSTPGVKTHAQFSPDSREVYYLEAGRVQTIDIDTRQVRTLTVNAEMDVDFDKEKVAIFEQAWAGQRDGFYDAKYHGADWNAVRTRYAPLVEAARTPDELRRLLRLMVGELNSSHSGVSAPPPVSTSPTTDPSGTAPRYTVGQLGLRFDRLEYEKSGKLMITSVVHHSPAELAHIQAGQELRTVDGVAMGPHVSLDEQLEHKVGRRVVLDVDGKSVTVLPVGTLAEQIYRQWVEENRAYVLKISNGRLGYVHIRDMSEEALTQLYLDLDAANRATDGIVVDLRNNNGGFVNAYVLDVFARRPYLTMTARGGPAGPARTLLGQRSLELPTILVVNQHSLSDAEDFTEGYRTLKLGKVVGEPTAGWIIYTGSMTLLDGSIMRMPGTLIQGADGKEMENNPRPVDIAVTRPIGESYTGRDSQLDAAVKELLSELPKR